MVEIILLIWLGREIGALAKRKGQRAGIWQINLVMAWIFTEIIGWGVGFLIFGKENLISIGLVGIAFAFTGYFGIRGLLEKYPDDPGDDINQIGS